MINMITTNTTPAIMRIVVGFIEALSLKFMFLPHLTDSGDDCGFEKQCKNTSKSFRHQKENQMI
ncbi:MAG: hypothetical protein DMG35_21725 [Acidobacteria bacterium]|nr:MAG: hypothetical protein DMG35_21725 [Acidobacteriota bacterium]